MTDMKLRWFALSLMTLAITGCGGGSGTADEAELDMTDEEIAAAVADGTMTAAAAARYARTLNVVVSGNGQVSSSPAGTITCPSARSIPV